MNAEARTADLLRRMPHIRQEILEKIDRGELGPVEQLGVDASDLRTFVEGKPLRGGLESAGQETPRQRAFEAIVRRFGRPVLLIQNDTYVAPELPAVIKELEPHRQRIEKAIRSVGRIEFINHPNLGVAPDGSSIRTS
jgi:endonuclease G, mitochondrial